MPSFTPQQLSLMVKRRGKELGFDLIGVAPVKPPPTYPYFLQWLEKGFHGAMAYMERGKEKRADPSLLLLDAKSVIVGAISYFVRSAGCDGRSDEQSTDITQHTAPSTPHGLVAGYACGLDYHEVLRRKLEALLDYLRALLGEGVKGKAYVDTGPILERDAAVQAGLGWVGKNTCLINPKAGSYLFLGELLVNVEIAPDLSFNRNHCGKCNLCLVACPTGAIVAPYQLDSRFCISYLTIELRGSIPRELRPLIGTWVFGCDICQEVCPWNKKAKPTQEEAFKPRPWSSPEIMELLSLTDNEFRERFRGSALKRAKRSGLVRNGCVAIGNLREVRALPLLIRLLKEDPDPVVREHAAWALGRMATPDALKALQEALTTETDERVRQEVHLSLQEAGFNPMPSER